MSDAEAEVITVGSDDTLLLKADSVKIEPDAESGELYLAHPENLDLSSFTAITLADGTPAFLAQDIMVEEGEDVVEAETVQLENGRTVYLQEIPKFVDGQAVQLEDGTTAYLQKESYQPVELEDGTTAYIALACDVLDPVSLETIPDTSEDSEDFQQVCVQTVDSPEGSAHVKKNVTIETGRASGSGNSEGIAKDRSRAYVCRQDGCNKFYTTLHHLKVHERSHTGDRPFRCPESGCGKAFATGYGRKAHVRTHTGEKPYKCPEETCNKGFKTSGDLQKHVRTHTGERPFRCPVEGCGRSFTTSNIRKVHVRTHTGEKPYRCPQEGCDRAFASATNYKNHLRIHSGEKPYVCSVEGCGKRFTEYSSLYKHHMVHTQQKPYYCSVCARHYRQASTLTMHKRTAHGIVETEDGTEIVLGKTVFALAKTSSEAKKLKALNANILGFKENNTLVALQSDSSGGLGPQSQFIVMADPSQLAALEQLGVTTSDATIAIEEKDVTELEEDSS
ncbi:Protein glass [Gryllus bimaculatus]|nr:Protein glass [Gryllus bimaculatus]